MATDPEQTLSLLSLASRAGFEGELQELMGLAALAFPPDNRPPQPSFPGIAHPASEYPASLSSLF